VKESTGKEEEWVVDEDAFARSLESLEMISFSPSLMDISDGDDEDDIADETSARDVLPEEVIIEPIRDFSKDRRDEEEPERCIEAILEQGEKIQSIAMDRCDPPERDAFQGKVCWKNCKAVLCYPCFAVYKCAQGSRKRLWLSCHILHWCSPSGVGTLVSC
jgi:hypothetical protein